MQEHVNRSLKSYYNQSEAYFDRMSKHDDVFFAKYIEFIARYLTGHEKRLLDIGCGPGLSSYLLAKKFSHLEVLGIDLSRKFIDCAEKKYRLPNLSYQVMDACQLQLADKSFDIIASNDVIEHIPDVQKHLYECDRVLSPKGQLFIMSPNILNPLMPLYQSLHGRTWRGRRLSLLKASVEFFNVLGIYIRKRLQKSPSFIYFEPVLDDSIQTGADADAVFLTNPLDLKYFFEDKAYVIHNLTLAHNTKMRMVNLICKYWTPLGFVAQKGDPS